MSRGQDQIEPAASAPAAEVEVLEVHRVVGVKTPSALKYGGTEQHPVAPDVVHAQGRRRRLMLDLLDARYLLLERQAPAPGSGLEQPLSTIGGAPRRVGLRSDHLG